MRLVVSVILPTFNRADLIGETLDTLVAQSRRPDEILVMDDGSTDETPEVLAKYPGLRVVRTENQGKAAALNQALDLVSGDLIWIVDDDDLLLPHACDMLSAPLEADPSLDYCAGRHLDFEVDAATGEKLIREPGYMRDSSPRQIFPDLLEGCHVFQPGLMVRRRVYDAVGRFDRDLMRSQDYEMILRIARRHRGLQLADVVFLHREHKGKRGTSDARFCPSQNADRWAQYNRVIYGRLLKSLEDDELLGDVSLPAALRSRAAQMKRGCVAARQRMWLEAVAYWRDACGMHVAPLTAFERELIARSPNSTLGAHELFAFPEVRAQLASISRMSPPGAELVRVLRRATLWHLRIAMREGDWPRAARVSTFLIGR